MSLKKWYKSVVLGLLSCGFGIFIGYNIALVLNEVSLLQSQNVRVAHQFYFSMNSLCMLKQYDDPAFKLADVDREKIDKLENILELCDPYCAFTIVYGEELTADEINLLRLHLGKIQDILVESSSMLTDEQISYLQMIANSADMALGSDMPLKRFCELIGDE